MTNCACVVMLQTVFARTVYRSNNIVWNHRFKVMPLTVHHHCSRGQAEAGALYLQRSETYIID